MVQKYLTLLLVFAQISTRLFHPHHFNKIFLYYCSLPYICTEISKCQTTNMQFFFKKQYCGFGANEAKICCLMLEEKTTTITTTAATTRVTRTHDDLINHKNFKLLPFDKCGVISSRFRITSGVSCTPGEFPWMALIAYETGNSTTQQDFKCGGTLISANYVLTAAHCIDNQTILGVRLGEYNINTEEDCDPNGQYCEPPVQDLLTDKTIAHPFYDPSSFINDIALVRLATSAHYNDNVRPICLPVGELLDVDLEGQDLTVAGWGATEEGDKSTTLRKVTVPVVPAPTCRRLYHGLKPITKRQICAGADHGRDSCAGDSGGPLKRIDFINSTPRYVQYGIVSFGPSSCGVSNRPGIYTNVQKYMRWILDNLE